MEWFERFIFCCVGGGWFADYVDFKVALLRYMSLPNVFITVLRINVGL